MSKRDETLKALLEEITGISDKDYQRRIWIRGEGPECDDFDETICRYFDVIDEIIEKKDKFNLLDSQFGVLVEFDGAFRAFCTSRTLEHYVPELFIDTPEWTRVTELGKKVLKTFNYKKKPTVPPSETERKRLRRESTLRWLFRELEGISDKEYQRRIWIRAAGPQYDNFRDSVCRYSSLSESFFDEYKYLGFSDVQFKAFKQLYDEFKKFWENNSNPALFIDTPEWTKITEMAKDVLEAFDYTKEKRALAILDLEGLRKNRIESLKFLLRNISKICTESIEEKSLALAEGDGSFFEVIHYYFCAIELILQSYKDYEISEAQLQVLKGFHERFEKFWNDKVLPQLFMDTPEWIEIVEMGKDVLKAFHYEETENDLE